MAVDAAQVASVTITGAEISGSMKSNETFRTYAPAQYEGLANKLIERGVVDEEALEKFLRPKLAHLSPPESLPNRRWPAAKSTWCRTLPTRTLRA